jgi:microcystin-dependent protein
MAKTKISEFDSTPANNTDIDSINIAEGCAPSGINNAIRELMSQLKDQQTGASGDNFTVGGNLAVTGTTTFTGIPSGPTASPGTNTTQLATTAFTLANANPTGSLIMWTTGTAPTGWLLCAGAAVSRSTYSALFAIIGTTFGVGDGSTTFNVPNYTNRMPYGATLGTTGGSATTTLITANLPSHTHAITDPGHAHGLTNLALFSDTVSGGGITIQTRTNSANTTATAITGITATDATGSGTAVTTISPYLGINFIIKT